MARSPGQEPSDALPRAAPAPRGTWWRSCSRSACLQFRKQAGSTTASSMSAPSRSAPGQAVQANAEQSREGAGREPRACAGERR